MGKQAGVVGQNKELTKDCINQQKLFCGQF